VALLRLAASPDPPPDALLTAERLVHQALLLHRSGELGHVDFGQYPTIYLLDAWEECGDRVCVCWGKGRWEERGDKRLEKYSEHAKFMRYPSQQRL